MEFRAGDDSLFADATYDDADWPREDTRLQADQPETTEWKGIGWFRLPFRVDSSMVDIPLGIRLVHFGAANVYLDGELLYSSGIVGATAAEAEESKQRTYFLFSCQEAGRHVLAVRYANHNLSPYQRIGWMSGFHGFILRDVNEIYQDRIEVIQEARAYQFFFMGLFIGFALLHLILFTFYPKATEHLYFALLLLVCTGIAYFFHQPNFTTEPLFYVYQLNTFNTLGLAICLTGLLFIYTIFYQRLPKFFYVIAALCAISLVITWAMPQLRLGFGLWVLLGACFEMLRVVFLGLLRRKPGARTIGFGILMLALSFLYVFLMDMGLLPQTDLTNELPFFGMLGLILMMSIFLSRNIAMTNRSLRQQIERVQELSEQKMQQEVERKLLEAEYEVKLQELEEARNLQLSMLPDSVPDHPAVELAA